MPGKGKSQLCADTHRVFQFSKETGSAETELCAARFISTSLC